MGSGLPDGGDKGIRKGALPDAQGDAEPPDDRSDGYFDDAITKSALLQHESWHHPNPAAQCHERKYRFMALDFGIDARAD